jgi:MSHA pilin protein MshC
MQFAIRPHLLISKQLRGFTLVELVIVILVLGILSVVVAPRFASTDTYAEFALQQRLQTALRTLQIQSMYDTRAGFCYQLNFAGGSAAGYGPSTSNYQGANAALSCTSNIDYNTPRYLRSDQDELVANGITLSVLDSGIPASFISFDNLGRAFTNVGRCTSGCEITFGGEVTTNVCISAQGFVHEC